MRQNRITNLLIVGLLFLVQSAQAHMNMGMNSPYGEICMDLLGTIYKFPGGNCTTSFRKGMCYCGDSDYVESVVACVSELIELKPPQDIEMRNQTNLVSHTKLDAYNTFLSMCSNLTLSDLQGYESKISSLPTYYGGDSGEKPGQWPVKSAFKLTRYELRHALKAYKAYSTHGMANKRYASALVAYWGSVVAIKSFVHLFVKLFPVAPLVVGNTKIGRFLRRYFQIRCYKYTLSTLLEVFIITGFLLVSVLLTFVNTHYYYPSYVYQYSSNNTYGYILGMRSGVYVMYILPLFFLFAGRNNLLQYITGWSQEPFLVFHRWIGRVEVILVLIHALAYTVQCVAVSYYRRMWTEAYWSWGIVALAFGGFILVQGSKFLRRFHYESFLVFHIISAAIYLVGVWYHLKLLGYGNFLKAVYATIAVWGFDRVARFCRILYCGPKKCYVTLEGSMLVLTLDKPKYWPVGIVPGTYIFVHFLMPLQFWQSHPLTLTSRCVDPTKIKLYFKIYEGISKTLANKIEKSGEKSLEMNILLDGPYGFSYDFLEYDECLYIVGGSGITVPLAYIQDSQVRTPNRKLQKTRVYWAVSDITNLSTFHEELMFLEKEAHVEVHLYISPRSASAIIDNSDEKKDPSEVGSYDVYPVRLDVNQVVENTINDIQGNLSVMCCGPPSIHAETRNAISNNMNQTKYYVQYFEETYTW